ncbi:hypothetical protein ACKLKD_25040 [Klebsiella sp. 10982]|uniref:hypothetical protein n=1 Tax=Klebsiella/Raoultella group TaxID=2890311 RepID=UPI000B419D62|nr:MULTISPECIES: hypothetical protein [Klebsiella/Raoultella group]QBL49970.1 hypothetical protein BMD99_016300 [Klebsiella sp. PO552]HBQ5757614.1 hypothetical protein [Klebsiella pneumoniae subsp. pneumoniae]ATM20449.1 hypothetical protein CRN13_08580 [Raoultella ornithinolytica]EIW5061515.1 hypothetical protein [Klebsiella pneumoniae]MBC5228164.1 hypothetical protein [Klebsiella pneumoniae]
MPFSIKKTVTVARVTDSGIPLSPASEDIDLMFKVSGLTISEAGKTAVVMVSADAGESYQFFENVSIEDDSITSLEGAEKYIRKTPQYQ